MSCNEGRNPPLLNRYGVGDHPGDRDPHMCPIQLSVYEDQMNFYSQLLDRRPEMLNMLCEESITSLLHVACAYGRLSIIQMLLERGANPLLQNGSGDTALHCAARRGDAHVVKLLLEFGISPNIQNGDKNTVMDVTTDPTVQAIVGAYL